jgi:hypothetical protein
MAESYKRNCRSCARRIQMRRMPGGQWLAFEGYDTIHDCASAPTRKERYSSSYQQSLRIEPESRETIYDGLKFDGDFTLGESDLPATSVTNDRTRPRAASHRTGGDSKRPASGPTSTKSSGRESRVEPPTLEPQPAAKSGCFVATAVYGDERHANVEALRRFRDVSLQRHAVGRVGIRLYYRVGPHAAKVVKRNAILKSCLRRCFDIAARALGSRSS